MSSETQPGYSRAPWPDKQMLKAEHEALGFYITAHPLDKYEGDLKRFTSSLTEQLASRDSSTKVSIGGVIQALKLRNSKKGERYPSFTLEDKTGTVDVIAWPDTYKKFECVFTTDEPVCVSGNLEVDEERCQIIADEVVLLTAARERSTQEVLPCIASRQSLRGRPPHPPRHPHPARRRMPLLPAPAVAEPHGDDHRLASRPQGYPERDDDRRGRADLRKRGGLVSVKVGVRCDTNPSGIPGEYPGAERTRGCFQ